MAGKVFTRILATRLSTCAESRGHLPEEQCGYRKNKGTLDLIALLRCAIDSHREADKEIHVALVDHKKAFDSANGPAMCEVLRRFGVPPLMLAFVWGLHGGSASIGDAFDVSSGVRQGCRLVPILFDLYLSVVSNTWKNVSPGASATAFLY